MMRAWKPEARAAALATQVLAKDRSPLAAPMQSRAMSNWRLRPYAAAGPAAAPRRFYNTFE